MPARMSDAGTSWSAVAWRSARARFGEIAGFAAIYAVGQIGNLLFQLLLLHHFGAEAYGRIGLAHLGFLLMAFAADLGYTTLFLREKPDAPGWDRQWRLALGHRMITLFALCVIVLPSWHVFGDGDRAGLAYVAATVPASLIGLTSLAPMLLAQGRRIASLIVQQMPWPAVLVVWGLSGGAHESALRAGLIVSAGFALQPIVALGLGGRARLLLPAFGAGSAMLGAALKISAIGIAGAVHDRLTPFLVARLAPDFLPALLLLGHGINGVAGVLTQINRLLLPLMDQHHGPAWSRRLMVLLLMGMALALQLLVLGLSLRADGGALLHPALLLPTLLAGGLAMVGSVGAIELIGRRHDTRLTTIIISGLSASVLLQIMAVALSSAEGVLWARAIACAGIAIASLKGCGISLSPAGWALCGSLALMAPALTHHLAWLASAALLGAAVLAVVCQRPLLGRHTPIAEPAA